MSKESNLKIANNCNITDWLKCQHLNRDIKRHQDEVITAGIDIGAVSSKAVILIDQEVYSQAIIRTRPVSSESAIEVLNQALKGTSIRLKDIKYLIGTGYGRVNIPFAQDNITEIACHARGAHHLWGSAIRTILDMGGQDCKVIHCDSKGKVTNFVMNDKCAAGTGRGIEFFAELLHVPIKDIGPISLTVNNDPAPLSNTCVVYAKSEAMNQLREGIPKNMVIAAFLSAVSKRVVELIKQLGLEEEFVITGGIAKNPGVVTRIEKLLGVQSLSSREVRTKHDIDPITIGALGAAVFASDQCEY